MLNVYKVLSLLFIFYSTVSFSQTASIDSTNRTYELEEIVISGIRAGSKIPISETTLTLPEIQLNYTGQEMPVMLARTPSITWYSDGGHYTGYSYMRLRGIDQTRINFTLNGVPLNEPEDQGVYFSNYPDFFNNVQSVQIQRGVGTSTNGTAAYGGSVNLESSSLLQAATAGIQMSYGSYNTWQVSPVVSSGLLKNKTAFYARYSATGSDGFREHSGTTGQTFFFSGGHFGKKSVLKFTMLSGSSKNEMAYVPVSEDDLKDNYRLNYLRQDEKDHFRQTITMLQYSTQLSTRSSFTSSLYYSHLNGNYDVYFDPDMLNFAVKSDFGGFIAKYHFENEHLELDGGVHANLYQRDHFQRVKPDLNSNVYLNTGAKEEASAFAKALYTKNNVSFFADAQFRWVHFEYIPDNNVNLSFQDIAWTFFNPKMGISYQLNKHQLYASLGRNGREPTRNDMLAGYDNIDETNYAEVGDFKKVKPEYVIDLEVGAVMNFKASQLDLNFYSMHFRNEIAAIGQLSYIGLPLRKNVQASYRRGIEVSAKVDLTKNVTASTHANLSVNRIKSYTSDVDSTTYQNVNPLLTPPILVNQSFLYAPTDWMEIEMGVRYTASSYLSNTNQEDFKTPPSVLLNTSIHFNVWKRHTLSLIANNITNSKYYTSGYVQNNESHYFAMALRNYYISMTLRF